MENKTEMMPDLDLSQTLEEPVPCWEEGEEVATDSSCNCDDGSHEECCKDNDECCNDDDDECCNHDCDDDDDETEWGFYADDDVGLGVDIRFQTAITTIHEFNSLSQLSSDCRKQIFEIIQKSDLDKEKIKDRLEKLNNILAYYDKRTDELVDRIERLTLAVEG